VDWNAAPFVLLTPEATNTTCGVVATEAEDVVLSALLAPCARD
jgi:hypothetical protein